MARRYGLITDISKFTIAALVASVGDKTDPCTFHRVITTYILSEIYENNWEAEIECVHLSFSFIRLSHDRLPNSDGWHLCRK